MSRPRGRARSGRRMPRRRLAMAWSKASLVAEVGGDRDPVARSGRGRAPGSSRTSARRAPCLLGDHRLDRRPSPSSPGAGGRSSRAAPPSMPVDADPAEEDVAGRLHQPLAGDDALAVRCGTSLRPTNASSTEGSASLTCRKSGSLASRPSSSTIQAAGADAAHPDHLARHVDEPVALEQVPAVARRVAPVARAERARALLAELVASGSSAAGRAAARSAAGRPMIRGSPSTTWVSLLEGLQAVPRAGLREALLGALARLALGDGGRNSASSVVDVEAARTRRRGCVIAGELAHRARGSAHGGPDDRVALASREAVRRGRRPRGWPPAA